VLFYCKFQRPESAPASEHSFSTDVMMSLYHDEKYSQDKNLFFTMINPIPAIKFFHPKKICYGRNNIYYMGLTFTDIV